MGRKRNPNKTGDTNPALIDNEAHHLIIRENTRRKLSMKLSPEECSYRYIISEAIKIKYSNKNKYKNMREQQGEKK